MPPEAVAAAKAAQRGGQASHPFSLTPEGGFSAAQGGAGGTTPEAKSLEFALKSGIPELKQIAHEAYMAKQPKQLDPNNRYMNMGEGQIFDKWNERVIETRALSPDFQKLEKGARYYVTNPYTGEASYFETPDDPKIQGVVNDYLGIRDGLPTNRVMLRYEDGTSKPLMYDGKEVTNVMGDKAWI
jgi:hypothetical protein